MTSLKSKRFISALLVLVMILTLLPTTMAFAASYKSVEEFVENLYVAGLDRQPDHRGFIYWVNELKKGRPAAEVIGFVLLDSEEFNEKYADISAKEFVKKAYEIVFGREADEEGLKFWVDEMRKGASQRYVIVAMLEAPPYEFKEFCDKVGIKAGTLPVRAEERPGKEYADEVAPVFDYKGETEFSVEYGQEFEVPVVKAIDNVDGEVEVTYVITDAEGNEVDEIDTEVPGKYTITYSAVDFVGNKDELFITVIVDEPILKVIEVSAINAKEIKVVFSQKVDKISAETAANYSIDTSAGAITAKLQEDGKTVILSLATGMTNNTAYTVKIKNDATNYIYNEAKTEKVPAYTTGIFFVDNEKPVVTEVKAEENGDVTIVFSEKLDTAVAVSVYIDGRAVTSSPVAPNADGTVTVPKENLPAGLENGKSYSIYVSGAKDLAGNEMNLYTGTFTYSYTVTAPVLKTATAKDEKTIEIEFSKDIAAPTAGTEVKVYKDNVELTGTTDYTIASVGTSAKKYTITLTPAGAAKVYANDATSAQLKIVAEGYKDTLTPPNIGVKVEKTVTLNKDLTKPALKGAVTYDPVTSTITVNFNKKLAAGSVASGIKVIDEDGVLYTAVNESGTTGKLVAADLTGGEEKIEIVNNDGTSAVLPNGTYTLIIEKDTVKDTTLNANGNDRIVTTFTIAGAPSTTKPTVSTITNTTPGIIEVTFNIPVKGTTATNPANYKINGIAIPADSTLYLDPTKTRVTIELPEGYFATTAARVVTVANVENPDGVKMDKHEEIVELKDNTRPKLLSAKVVDNELVLTFSEDVSLTGTTISFKDFEVKVNNVLAKVAAGKLTGLEKNQISISVTDANLATGTIVVKVKDRATGADAEGNVIVTGTTVTATR